MIRHIEGVSTNFGTTLNYVVMRLLGVPADHPVAVRARKTMHGLGSACAVPAWGKFWLSVLNVYEWEGNNPIPPELWYVRCDFACKTLIHHYRVLPDWFFFHPHRWWIHCRNVYIPMSYLYGTKFKAPENDLVLALREELYTQPYESIDWPAQRNNVCPIDIYHPHTVVANTLFAILGVYEQCTFPPLRNAGLKKAYELVVMEDDNTSYQTLGPVSKMMNLICRTVVEGIGSEAWKMHKLRRKDFMWIGKEGMRMCGTNGSQLWDIAFISQALAETGLAEEEAFKEQTIRALKWLDECQIQKNPPFYQKAYRHRTKGAWPFSTKEQGYTVSDCTGEGLKATLYLQKHLRQVTVSNRVDADFGAATLHNLSAISVSAMQWTVC